MNHLRQLFVHHSSWLTVAALCAVVFLTAPAPALAAGGDQIFGGIGDALWRLGEGLIRNVGRGATLLGGAWAVLAFMGRLGHLSAAVGVFVSGVFLANLTTLVNYLFPA